MVDGVDVPAAGMTAGSPVAVIGAGVQGVSVALELERRGCRVHLFEAESAPFLGASGVGEGKLHCGLVYAMDPSGRTVGVLQRGALSFARLVGRWAGRPVPDEAWSEPFWYAVHADSLLSADAIERHYARVERALIAAGQQGGSYPGWNGGRLFERASPQTVESLFAGRITAAFRTAEVAVDPAVVSAMLFEAVDGSDEIEFLPGHRVTAVKGEDEELMVVTTDSIHGPYGHVVNASWAGRLELDAGRGIVPERPWLHRYKVGVHFAGVDIPSGTIPSTTVVQGPFGDVLDRRSGEYYLSWYPVCRLGSSDDLHPAFDFTDDDRRACITPTITALEQIVPAVGRLREAESVDARGAVIFSWGDQDIHVEETDLHHRHDIGPLSAGNYHTVNTGKFTTAPLFAAEVGWRIAGG